MEEFISKKRMNFIIVLTILTMSVALISANYFSNAPKNLGQLSIIVSSASSAKEYTTTASLELTTTSASLVVCLAGTSSGVSSFSISDSSDLSWTVIKHVTGNVHSIEGYYALSPSALSNDKVSVVATQTASSTILKLFCFAVYNANGVDTKSVISNGGRGTKLGADVAASAAPELVVGFFDVGGVPIITGETGYNNVNNTKTNPSTLTEDKIQSSSGDYNVTASLSSSENWSELAFGVTFSAATTSTTTTSTISQSSTTTSSSTSSSTVSSASATSSASSSTSISTDTLSSTSASSDTTSSSSESSTMSTSATGLNQSSAGNTCFRAGVYNSNVSTIDSYYYECSATLAVNQSISQYMLRNSQLYGNFVLTVNASQPINVTILQGGVMVFTQTGTTIKYSGTVGQGQLVEVTITNSSKKSQTTYELGIDF